MPRISQLPVKSLAAAVDLLAIVDTSTGITKQVTAANFIQSAAITAGGIKASSVDHSVADQTARDALTPFEGLLVFRKDTDAIEIYDGSAWLSFDTKWQTFTPVIYTNGVAYTLGNGTAVGRYMRSGKKCSVKVRIQLGSSTTWGGTGGQEIGLPFISNYTATKDGSMSLGAWTVIDSGVASSKGGVELSATTSRALLTYHQYGGTTNNNNQVTDTAPFTTANGDVHVGQFEYEMA